MHWVLYVVTKTNGIPFDSEDKMPPTLFVSQLVWRLSEFPALTIRVRKATFVGLSGIYITSTKWTEIGEITGRGLIMMAGSLFEQLYKGASNSPIPCAGTKMDSLTNAPYQYHLDQPKQPKNRNRENIRELPEEIRPDVRVIANPVDLHILNQGSQPVHCPRCKVVTFTKAEFVIGSNTQYFLHTIATNSVVAGHVCFA